MYWPGKMIVTPVTKLSMVPNIQHIVIAPIMESIRQIANPMVAVRARN